MRILIIITLSCLTSSGTFAQNSLEKEFALTDSTFVKTYSLEVAKGMKQFSCRAKGRIEAGEVYFKILDPEGKQESILGLMADTPDDNGSNIANGIMTDSFSGPLPGKWTAVLEVKSARGIFDFDIHVE